MKNMKSGVPLGYTLMRQYKSVSRELVSPIWDIPYRWKTSLTRLLFLGIIVATNFRRI